jgi:peptidoglycan/xylan/chitin deacetylase (PgdA/CDA1 family)
MRKKFLTLCIDLEEFNLSNEFGVSISREDAYKISKEGLVFLYNLLEEFKIKSTFFCNENIAKAFPELLKSLAKSGHEIALHGIIENWKADVVVELKRQKSIIQNITEKEIYGFRSHKLIYLPSDVLRKAGLIYDNSLHPTYVPGRYCNVFSPRRTYVEDGIIRIPISVTPLFRLPFSWVWFRNLGLWYVKFCSQVSYLDQDYVNIYFHSWDFANVENWPLKWRYKFLLHNSGDKMLAMLTNYLNWCKGEGIRIITMFGYINEKRY